MRQPAQALGRRASFFLTRFAAARIRSINIFFGDRACRLAGRWLLEYARGRDVTALFHSIHLRSEGATNAALAKLPQLDAASVALPSSPGLPPSALEAEGATQGAFVLDLYGDAPAEAPLPQIDSPLRRDLRSFLRKHFPTAASSKATAGHWGRIALSLAATLACWAGWAHGSAFACLLLPFVHWVLIAHTVHEATHGNLSTDPRINYWGQFTAHPICFNVFVWIPQHLLSHHQYTNDHRHDVDCHHFAPAMISDEQPPMTPGSTPFNEAWTFVWKGFLTTLGTSILQPLRTLREAPTPNYDVNVTPVPAAVDKRTLLLSIVPSFLVLLYPLIAFVPSQPLLGMWLTAWPWIGMSLIFTTSAPPASPHLAASDPTCVCLRRSSRPRGAMLTSLLARALLVRSPQ